jgi:hypothetical protein
MLLHRCMHCLAANSCEVRFDKKGRPYTVCKCCWTKAFFQSLESLRGVAVAPALLERALQERAQNPAYAKWFDEQIASMVKHVRERTLAPARPAADNAPLADVSPIVPFEGKASA